MWYVITTEGKMIRCSSKFEAINICADLGAVWSYGFAKHLSEEDESDPARPFVLSDEFAPFRETFEGEVEVGYERRVWRHKRWWEFWR